MIGLHAERLGRWRGCWLAGFVLIGACAFGLGGSAAAARRVRASCSLPAASCPLPGSNFQGGDGNQADEAPYIDWQGLEARGRVNHKADCPTGVMSPCPTADDDIFGGPHSGLQKEKLPGNWFLTVQHGGGANPSDANILDSYWAFLHRRNSPPFLYLAFTREAPHGTSFITFELNQVAGTWNNGHADIPCRTTGDILIEFAPQGNTLDIFNVQEWVTTVPAPPATGCATEGMLEDVPFTSSNFQAAFNDSPIHNYLPPTSVDTIDTGNFAEAAINLKSLLHGDQEGCSRFASIWMHSRSSSDADTSDMIDYVAPTDFVVRTCKATPSLSTMLSVVSSPGVHRAHDLRSGAVHRKHRSRRRAVHRSRRPRFRSTLGQSIIDTASLGPGGDNPTGAITFDIYGPETLNDTTCSGPPTDTLKVKPIGGEGHYDSPPYTPRAVGTYRWKVTYSGDDNNNKVVTDCNAETVEITAPPVPATPTLKTQASMTTVLGNPISDSATLDGGLFPTGKIAFNVYGPVTSPTSCAPLATPQPLETAVHDNGTYSSPDFTPTKVGMYLWIATYSGDSHNEKVATSCGDMGESVIVDPAPPPAKPNLTSTASPGGPIGSPLQDTAHLSGGSSPTGTITFNVYGPDDPACKTPAAPSSTVPVSGAGDYHSGPFTPTAAGTYRWIASYSGDANNSGAATMCGDSTETVVVSKAQPTLRTVAAPVVVKSGGTVGDTALLAGASNPQGTITFSLYGPNDNSCSEPPAFVGAQSVSGNGSYSSPTPAPTAPGTYRWVATYSGDANNAGTATTCGEAGETVVVQPVPPQQTPDQPKPKPKPKPHPKPPPPPRVTG